MSPDVERSGLWRILLATLGLALCVSTVFWIFYRGATSRINVRESSTQTDEMSRSGIIELRIRSDGAAFSFTGSVNRPNRLDFAEVLDRVIASDWREVAVIPDEIEVGRKYAHDLAKYIEQSGKTPPREYSVWVLNLYVPSAGGLWQY